MQAWGERRESYNTRESETTNRGLRRALLFCGTGGNGGGGGGGIRRELFMNGGPNSGSEPSNLLGLD